MNGSEIVLLAALCVAFAFAVGYIVFRKVKNKGGCIGCDGCDGCCEHCKARAAKKDK